MALVNHILYRLNLKVTPTVDYGGLIETQQEYRCVVFLMRNIIFNSLLHHLGGWTLTWWLELVKLVTGEG